MTGKGGQAFKPSLLTARTTDHIVPQSKLTIDHPISQKWHNWNCVQVCFKCNGLKADMWPLDWLEIMPVRIGAQRLALRLAKLGCPQDEIDEVMKRRKA